MPWSVKAYMPSQLSPKLAITAAKTQTTVAWFPVRICTTIHHTVLHPLLTWVNALLSLPCEVSINVQLLSVSIFLPTHDNILRVRARRWHLKCSNTQPRIPLPCKPSTESLPHPTSQIWETASMPTMSIARISIQENTLAGERTLTQEMEQLKIKTNVYVQMAWPVRQERVQEIPSSSISSTKSISQALLWFTHPWTWLDSP